MESLYFNILFTICFVAFLAICKILQNKHCVPDTELFYQSSSKLVNDIISKCPSLQEKYIPVYIWGKCGHLQSAFFSVLGRFGNKDPAQKKRYELLDKDGALISYDMFFKSSLSEPKEDVIVVVPGICNTGESDYVHSFSCFMNKFGYDVAVLNHTGALKETKITYPRIFSYGKTNDLDLMVNDLYSKFGKKFIGVGFSLGGHILMKYLGESKSNENKFHLAASICQGYDLLKGYEMMHEWGNMRKLYNFVITKNMLKVITRHKDSFKKHSEEKQMNWHRIESATSLHELDSEFTLKMFSEGHKLEDWYKKESCSLHLKNVQIPVLMVNAKDDPLIPECLFEHPKSLVERNKDSLFVVTEYGGHLGFFEGGYLVPNRTTWIDRVLLEYFDATVVELKQTDRY